MILMIKFLCYQAAVISRSELEAVKSIGNNDSEEAQDVVSPCLSSLSDKTAK